MINCNEYPLRVFKSDEDGGFIAEAIDLPGCSAFGETIEEACHEIQDAIAAWLKAASAAKNPIPSPSKGTSADTFSGRIALRIPRTLHGKLWSIAKAEGQSLNSQIVTALTSFTATWRPIVSTKTSYVGSLNTLEQGAIASAIRAALLEVNDLGWHHQNTVLVSGGSLVDRSARGENKLNVDYLVAASSSEFSNG